MSANLGIVYDTGGMQIKGRTTMPSNENYDSNLNAKENIKHKVLDMKCDMGGAAAVLAAFCTLVKAGCCIVCCCITFADYY